MATSIEILNDIRDTVGNLVIKYKALSLSETTTPTELKEIDKELGDCLNLLVSLDTSLSNITSQDLVALVQEYQTQFSTLTDSYNQTFSNALQLLEDNKTSLLQEVTQTFNDKETSINNTFDTKLQEVTQTFNDKETSINNTFDTKLQEVTQTFTNKETTIDNTFDTKFQQINTMLQNGTFDGKSAYELAVQSGYAGTLEQWLESLKSTLDYNQLINKPISLNFTNENTLNYILKQEPDTSLTLAYFNNGWRTGIRIFPDKIHYYDSESLQWLVFTSNRSLIPAFDNYNTVGSASFRFSTVFAASNVISTSDERDKQQIRDITSVEKEVAIQLKSKIKAFKFNEAVEKKGDEARIHFGVVAQEIKDLFISNGLDPFDYALFCFDVWDEELGEDGEILVQAGERYGIRYEQLLAFIISAI